MKIADIWLTDKEVWIKTEDGREASERFADYPRLRHASMEQLENYHTSDYGIHWPELDEDLSFEGFFKDKNTGSLYGLFLSHPELNASALARRLGMSQSLLAQYISGIKRPSEERMELIKSEIRKIGQELSAIQ